MEPEKELYSRFISSRASGIGSKDSSEFYKGGIK